MKTNLNIFTFYKDHRGAFGLVKLFAILFFLLCITITAAAHSNMADSDPKADQVLAASPDEVTAWFTEELDSGFSTMRVYDAQNRQVDNGDGRVDLNDLEHLSMVVSLPSLPSGEYTVKWTIVSADDGDPSEGEFSFSIDNGVEAQDTASQPFSLLEWILIGTGVLLVFVLVFTFYSRRKLRSE